MNGTAANESASGGPLRVGPFRRLWLANVCSGVGSAMHDTAAAWTMTSLTTSPALVSLMQSMSSLPLFLFALPAGALADILDRRRLVLWAQGCCFFFAAGLGVAAWTGHVSIAVLLAVTFLLGVGNAVTLPAWQALIPELVGRRQLPAALTLGGIGVNIARALGPVVGGLLLAAAGAASVFGANALTFVGLLGAVVTWRRPAQPIATNPEKLFGAMAAAFRFTRHSAAIRAVLVRNGWFAFCGIAPSALIPLILRSRGAGALEFGLQMGSYGMGGILMAFLVMPRLRKALSPDRLLAVAGIFSAASIGGLAFVRTPAFVSLLMLCAGAAWLANMTTFSVAGQSAFPNWVRARSSAIQILVAQGSLALGALTWGQLATQTTPTMALQLAAGGMLAGLLLISVHPLNRIGELDLTPSRHWAEHHLAIEPQSDDGPVLVSVDYDVPVQEQDSFRQAMAQLRTIRLRDGAFRWSLFHDLADPNHFRESFLVGSWAEHLRQHDRATMEDKRVEEAALRYHAGAEPPRVSHFLMNLLDSPPPKGAKNQRSTKGNGDELSTGISPTL